MKLQRSIGLVGLTFVAISGMLGSGWLFAPQLVAENAGPAAVLSWLIGAVFMFLLAITFAEVSAMLPVAGGLARVPHFSHGNVVSAVMGWTAWIGYTLTAPIEVAAMLKYLAASVPWTHQPGSSSLNFLGSCLAMVFMALMVVINAWGVSFFSKINTGLTWIKIIVPTVIVIAFIYTRFDFSNFTTPEFSPFDLPGVLAGVSTGGVIFAFIGFRHAIDLAGETVKPHRNIPLALCFSILFCLLIYMGAQIAFIGALPTEEVSRGWKALSLDHDYGPFAALGTALGMLWIMSIIYAGAIIAPFGGGLVATGSDARLAMAMADNGQFPKIFSKLSPRSVPFNAMVLNWILGSAMLFIIGFEEMVTLNGASIVLSLVVGPIALYALRSQIPDRPRYFRVPAVTLVGNCAFIGATWTLYWSGWRVIEVLMVLIVVGLILFLILRRVSKDLRPLDLKQAVWMIPYLLALGLLSHFGNFGGGTGLIPFGWDLGIGAVFSVLSFTHAYHCRLPAHMAIKYIAEVEIGRDTTTLEPYPIERDE
ncbi:MAG: amino acid permease [Sneathiella sp.]|nr:MAG: amino acid permease [Sneathiella sp.]